MESISSDLKTIIRFSKLWHEWKFPLGH